MINWMQGKEMNGKREKKKMKENVIRIYQLRLMLNK